MSASTSTSSPWVYLLLLIPVAVFILFGLALGAIYRNTRKIKGRTIREFHSDGNIWGILDSWAEKSKYELLGQDEDSRTYRKPGGYATSIIIPTVQVGWSGSGYWLAAWLAVSTFGRFFPHGWVLPEEMVLDVKSALNWLGDSYPLET